MLSGLASLVPRAARQALAPAQRGAAVPLGGADGLPALLVGQVRCIGKYKRNGFWARGEQGQYTTHDPRIFVAPPARKYPYHKQRQWSKPYMCLRATPGAPAGGAVRLAISYLDWSSAEQYYALRRALQEALPGAQILGEQDPQLEDREAAALRVLRLNDGRELLKLKKGEEVAALAPDAFAALVAAASDNFNWRYGAEPEPEAELS